MRVNPELLRPGDLKKQSQFIRIAYCVLPISERKKVKMSVNLEFIRGYS